MCTCGLRCTGGLRAEDQERRASARRGSQPHRQARFRTWAHAVFAAHTVVARRNRSGGREPAVGRITRVQRCSAAKHRQSPACWRHCSYKRVLRTTGAYARACFRAEMCAVTSSAFRLPHHGGLTLPALVRACSPAGGIATFPMHKRTFVKSGWREPAVLREPHRQPRLRTRARAVAGAASAVFGAIAAVPLRMRYREPRGLTPTALVAVAGERESNCLSRRRFTQHGGLTPPALVRACSPAGGIATFAMHERTFVRSGGREPAVVRESHWQRRLRSTRAVAGAASAVFRATAAAPLQMRYREPRGGLRPRLLWRSPVNGNRNRLSKRRFTHHGG